MTFTGDEGVAFCYQRFMLGEVKTMQCVRPVHRDRLCSLWSFSFFFFVSFLPPFHRTFHSSTFLHIQVVPGSNLVHDVKLKAFKFVNFRFKLNAKYFISIVMFLYMFRAHLCPSSGGRLYIYNIWFYVSLKLIYKNIKILCLYD